jgi:predicted ATPase/DNA-binding winged helix-turn-helix (wHTH) protein
MTARETFSEVEAFQFGDFVLRPAVRSLEKLGEPVSVGARAFDILQAFIRSSNELVTVAELKETVWKDLHVEDVVLRVHISSLRKILGDGYIKNVAGRGYCIATEITAIAGKTANPDIFYREKLRRLPQFPLRLIGRDAIIEQVCDKLSARRFISIVGPGGVGKTTIALVAGERLIASFEDAICFVDLSPLTDPALVTSAIASSLGLAVSTSDPQVGLLKFLRDKTLLFVLDNCEHVLEGVAPIVEAIFSSAPRVHLLTTSREPLRARGEHVLRVRPLKVPGDAWNLTVEEVADYPAVQLFLERAAAAEGIGELDEDNAAIVAEICRKLEGLPLAIELAAARCDVYTLPALNAALDDRVRMLWTGRRTAPHRHQTLDALIDWSFTLLDETERAVLMAISVFQGKFRLRAAEAVAGPRSRDLSEFRESFQKLVSNSLVSAELTGDEPRYRLLDATRAFATAKLDQSDFKITTKRRHLNCLLDAANRAEAAWGEQSAQSWLEAFGILIDDLRATIDWAFSSDDEIRDGIRLVAASSALWFRLSLTSEYRKRLLTALAALDAQREDLPNERMLLNIALGYATWHTSGAPKVMSDYFSEAASLAEELHDLQNHRLALWGLWRATSIASDEPRALEIAEQHGQLVDPATEKSEYLTNLRMKALSLHWIGRQQEAEKLALEIFEKQSDVDSESSALLLDPRVACEALISRLYWLRGYPAQAVRMAESCFELATRKQHVLSMCYSLVVGLCPISFWTGDYDKARFYTDKLLTITSSYGYPHWANFAVHYLGMLAHLTGETSRDSHHIESDAHHNPFIDELMATVSSDFLPLDVVKQLQTGPDRWCSPELLRIKATKTEDADEREELLRQSLALSRTQGALSWELRAATSLATHLAERKRKKQARDVLSKVYAQFTEGFETRDLILADKVLKGL